MVKHFTNFKTHYTNPIRIPDIISDTGECVKTIDVGQLPEE